MHVKRVILSNFRNIATADVELGGGINIMHGDNAQGKTNFLEAVYFSSVGRSHRASRDRELVNIGEKTASSTVFVEGEHGADKIATEIDKDGKKMWVNGLPIKRLGELFGHLLCVIFSPEDLSLIKAGPGLRRRFMDMELCQMYPAYYHNLRMYYKVMKQRNNLLREIYTNPRLSETLEIWDEQLVAYGKPIIAARKTFVAHLSQIADINQNEITGGGERLEIIYKNNTEADVFFDRLAKNRHHDIHRKHTSIGIHKDDMDFKINQKDGRLFASQGQQRTAALSIKLAQIDLIKKERGTTPVLLLDDILSELDGSRQKFLMDKIHGLQSIITLTGAEAHFKTYASHPGTKIFNVEKGFVNPTNVIDIIR
ncbi:MAG: DNA replication/repair protein RecF [Defluviitaleaceae bacterium]|nr:DNA replication/repair protein RecF [Defluviitaleaceae bacterium]